MLRAERTWRVFSGCISRLKSAPHGVQRSSALGKHQPDVDLILTQPTTDETAWVQIKSKTNQAELNDYLGRFQRDGSCGASSSSAIVLQAHSVCPRNPACTFGPPSASLTLRSTPVCSIG
jgi:hypothetical protein